MANKKNTQLFSILDDIYEQWVVMDGNLYTSKPNRLDKLERASQEMQEHARRLEEHIYSMRRKPKQSN